jgi:hypothetical protein
MKPAETALCLVSGIVLAVLGCSLPPAGSLPLLFPEGGGIAVVDELFEKTTLANGAIRTIFHINDPRYWTAKGYTIWTMWDEGATSGDSIWERSVDLSKVNGYRRAGYGLVLCQGPRTYLGQQEETMLTFMINNEGEYAIGKVIGSQYNEMQPWTKTAFLEKGAGSPNTVKISYDPADSGFTLSINGYFIQTFNDPVEPKHGGGKNGYIVVLSPLDKFPADDVDVYFTEFR